MYPAGNLFIPAAHGRLEGIIKEPGADTAARGAALVLHPHPLHGGTMHNKVAFRAARALNEAGCVALRVNFRGTGRSTGTHDHARGGEQEDARAALDYLSEKYPSLPLVLAGFSFGARVGLEVGTRDARVSALVGIGTPVSIAERGYDFSFLRECRKPVLFVHGERDEFGDVATLRSLAATIPAEARVRVEVVPGAGHFFDQQLDEMSRVIREWAERILNGIEGRA
ncbi:MAG: alpha/beta hydrolase [Acidobacteria bacterium]|nr:alpha/beta hydrolase [Acidobacteriota bacterium]MCA1641977.1 alpha/beta hydrolase [Acidobacteriota bacterium]